MPSCPRCLRPLPPTANALCVYCGASLTPSQPKNRPLPARSTDPLVGRTVAGRFNVEELIGQGGMGKVYRARHLALDRPVVLKMLKPALLEDPTIVGRFEREAKAASRLNHPNVIQVLDFGIAKLLDAEGPGLTSVDVVCGTPQYMAPEQATGTHLDARCDLYAVGVILYQMATGHLPFDGANSMEVLTKQVHDRPIPPRQRQPDAPISEAMEALILRSLEKDAARRPQTAEQFRDELLAVPAKAREKRASLQAAEPLLRVPTPTTSPKPHKPTPPEAPRKARRWWWPFPSAGS